MTPNALDVPPRASADPGPDPELLALPAPKRRTRTLSLVLMALTTALALAMIWALRGEVRYALASGRPTNIGDLASFRPRPDLADAFVHATGVPNMAGGIDYERFLDPDGFLAIPIVGNERLWIELRRPSSESPRPQTSFVGRLVPLATAGLQYRGLTSRIEEQANVSLTRDAWLLVEGATPASSRWSLALAFVLSLFAGWNLFQLLRLTRRVQD